MAAAPAARAAQAAADTAAGTAAARAAARRQGLRQLIRYTLVGGTGVTLDLAVFLLLYNMAGLHEQAANAISTTAGITNNFILNAVFTFDRRDRLLVRFLRFYAVGLSGIVLTHLLLVVCSGRLGVDPNLVKAASLPLVLAVQFVLNRKWSFG
ncbi:GtrA family protein [Streptomyces aidingensis]|uniref:GtrA family protein n=1 Tax=Streptomyces aidingensis TaxID=910347 RepID=UPI000B26D658|nr:GtrA family protein [Streptomyces aidingensis]